MVSLEVFIFGLLAASVLTGLVTEAIKKVLVEFNKTYKPNILAGIVATVLALAISLSYVVLTTGAFTTSVVICIVSYVILSWLCAMLGYDKVIQTLSQLKIPKEEK